jgi:Cu-Zn family superoxide dismutase
VLARVLDPSLRFPTTIALARGRMLAVNSQFDRQGGTPELPFTVSSIPIP